MGFKTLAEKLHRKPSRKSCSGKTNIRIIFVGDTFPQGTFEYIYCPIKKFSEGGTVFGNN